jgi:hypothetical protein
VYTVGTALAVSGTIGSVTPDYDLMYNLTGITVEFIREPSTIMLVAAGFGSLVLLRRGRG